MKAGPRLAKAAARGAAPLREVERFELVAFPASDYLGIMRHASAREAPGLPGAAEALARLSSIVPFRYLRAAELEALMGDSGLRAYAPGDSIVRQGETGSDEVFVLLSGSVESVDLARNPPFRMNVIDSGSYFGERSALFDAPRLLEMRALEPAVCVAIPGPRFLRLLSGSRSFAQAFGAKLRDSFGLFDAFDRFNAEVARGAALGHIEIRRLVELYKGLEPALHPHASSESEIDWSALSYAVRRLPENVTRSFVYLLTDNLPSVFPSPTLLFPFVDTEARHRFVYEMMPGKDMVLVRSGMSDLMDFLTCLCLFAVEARKIRYRLNHPDLILALTRFAPAGGLRGGAIAAAAETAAAAEGGSAGAASGPAGRAGGLLEGLPFSAEEREELVRLWPADAGERVRDIVFHRQAYSVDVRKQVNNYNGSLSELWASEVGQAAEELLGVRPSDFPEDLVVHLVSSNTHSVSNCLSSYFTRRSAEILSWAEREGLRSPGWTEPFDEVYHLSRPWFASFPEARRELAEEEAACGIVRLPETATTGIQVQLIDAASVCGRAIDPGIEALSCPRRALIVNIDYAFGEQAEEIMRSLLLLFGRNVRSINVLGKAGALQGGRGDVLVPTAFIEQASDAFLPLPAEEAGTSARLSAALPGRGVVEGPLLTVGGTLLQNRPMLQFYKRIWGCVGLEMEGIWYLRAVLEAEELGVLRPGARRRFFYYVSDLPLNSGEKLSARLSPQEGVPPLYAVTREVLRGIFGGG